MIKLPSYYLPNDPDEINEQMIDDLCFDMKTIVCDLIDNPGDEGLYDSACDVLKHVGAIVDVLMSDDDE